MQLKSAAPMVTRSCGAEPSLLISSDRIQNTRRYRRRYSRKRAKSCRKFARYAFLAALASYTVLQFMEGGESPSFFSPSPRPTEGGSPYGHQNLSAGG